MSAAPRRIVSLVPSTTESVCELGAAQHLVGCTRFCTEPAAALRDVARIGGTKNPDREAIARLAPDLILGNAEENRAEDLAWLAERFPILVQTPRTVAAACADLRALAARIACSATATPLLGEIEALLADAPAAASGVRVYYAIWRKPWMTVNGDTFVHDVLRSAGARNVGAAESARYPELSPERALALGVDVVLLASEPWAFDEAQRAELVRARTFANVPLLLCDGRDFCWHGTHMAIGLARARALLRRVAVDPVDA